MKNKMIGLQTAVIALVVVPGFVATASASAATVAAASGSRAAHVSAVGKAWYDITNDPCQLNNESWVHLTLTTGTTCYGGLGTVRFASNTRLTKICSGNNFGSILYTDAGVPGSWNFSPGQTKTFSPYVVLTELTISKSLDFDICA